MIIIVSITLQIAILRKVFKHWVINDQALPVDLLDCNISEDQLKNELKLLDISGLIKITDTLLEITPAGRSKIKVVLTGGAYDLLHKGHIITLQEAKQLGDFLVVVVARDVTVKNRKRKPIHSEQDRVFMLNQLKIVDVAILGDEIDHMRVVRRIKPNIVALGADQDHIKEVLLDQFKDQGQEQTKIMRLKADYEGLATSRLIQEILHREDLKI